MPGETILLVEDNSDVSTVFTEVLETLGYRVLSAPSGEEALRIGEREGATIRLVLTDLTLSGMTGTDVCRALRARGLTPPAIVFSGYPPPPGATAVEGVVAWLQKPFAVDELLAAVRRALS